MDDQGLFGRPIKEVNVLPPVVEDPIGQPASPQVAAREGGAFVFEAVVCDRFSYVNRMLDRLHMVLNVAHSTVVRFVKVQNIEHLRIATPCSFVPFKVKHEARLVYAFIT